MAIDLCDMVVKVGLIRIKVSIVRGVLSTAIIEREKSVHLSGRYIPRGGGAVVGKWGSRRIRSTNCEKY
jgi:hypothetical protein